MQFAEARQLMMQITEEEEGPTSDRLGREMLTDIAAHEDVEKPHGEKGHGHGHGHGGGSAQAAVMIWLGILIDAVPESLVIGILWVSKGLSGMLPFLIGVFLSNLPKAMSSSGTMRVCMHYCWGHTRGSVSQCVCVCVCLQASGMRVPTIYLMWTGIVIVTGVGAGIGAAIFPPGEKSEGEEVSQRSDRYQLHGVGRLRAYVCGSLSVCQLAIGAVEGLAAGAMLTMIAQTMLPEAFDQARSMTHTQTDACVSMCLSVCVCVCMQSIRAAMW